MQPALTPPAGPPGEDAARLKLSFSLDKVPAERPPAPAPGAVGSAQAGTLPPQPGMAGEPPGSGPLATLRQMTDASSTGLVSLTVGLGGIALLTSMGWLMERRRRRQEEDSVLWADVQPAAAPSSIVTRVNSLDDILPDDPNPAESARAIYVTAIGETTSRREATLIDLHQLDQKLERRRKRGDRNAAVLLLQQHLVDFRYTSPWVFLELRELYLELDLHAEWEVARDAFKTRFGQNAPTWGAQSTANAALLDDFQLCSGLSAQWPHRPARMWVLRWMLGEHDMRIKAMGPPLLPLGVYRDLMMLDTLLDDVMPASTAYQDTI
ncbi:MAG: hypothetical protein V4757_03175 [Pseudomonadota bacterium]